MTKSTPRKGRVQVKGLRKFRLAPSWRARLRSKIILFFHTKHRDQHISFFKDTNDYHATSKQSRYGWIRHKNKRIFTTGLPKFDSRLEKLFLRFEENLFLLLPKLPNKPENKPFTKFEHINRSLFHIDLIQSYNLNFLRKNRK